MKKSFYSLTTLLLMLMIISGCRTDQALFSGAVTTGGFAVIGAIVGIIYVLKKIL